MKAVSSAKNNNNEASGMGNSDHNSAMEAIESFKKRNMERNLKAVLSKESTDMVVNGDIPPPSIDGSIAYEPV